MTSTVDVNLMVYAADTGSDRHDRARQLLSWVATTSSITYLFWPALLGYVRIVTHPGILEAPLALDEALASVEGLVARPQIVVPGETESFWARFRAVARSSGARGNLVPDAHLVALMHSHDVRRIWTADRGFRRFDGIQVEDPFADSYAQGFG